MQVTGAQALVAALERLGVDVVFGIPGGRSCRPMTRCSTPAACVTSSSGTNREPGTQLPAMPSDRPPGVCMATSGRRDQLVTPLADAYMDSVPVVAITGQVPSALIGTDGSGSRHRRITLAGHQA